MCARTGRTPRASTRPHRDIEALDLDGLKRLVLQLLKAVASLKGLKGWPKHAPSGMEAARRPSARPGPERITKARAKGPRMPIQECAGASEIPCS